MRFWVSLVVVVAVLALLLVFLSSRVGEQPLVTREQPVDINELSK